MSEALVEYLAKRDAQIDAKVTSPMYDAWLLQEDIKAREKQLEIDKARLAEMMKALTVTDDAAFNVSNMKKVHTMNEQWIAENMPEVYADVCKMTPTARMQTFCSCFTDAEIEEFIAERKPEEVRKLKHITKTDFQKAIGKKKYDSLCGKAYTEEWVAQGKSEIVLKLKPVMLDYGSMELEEEND